MKTSQFFLLFLLAQFFVSTAFAETGVTGFVTPRDLVANNALSNITLQNNRSSAATVYGLYVRELSYVTPGNSCSSGTVIYSASSNKNIGAFVMPVVINPGRGAIIGSNYLYNLLYQVFYYVGIIYPSSPPGCFLPGCTWGADTTTYNWCMKLGALAPVANSADYTSNVPPSMDPASGSGYDYNLISNYVMLGPISCSDQTMTCSAPNRQTQSFS